MPNFFDDIDSIEKLKNKLKEKGRNHKSYSFYVESEYIDKSIEGIRLSTGKKWNDPIDVKNLKDEETVLFVKSFTFSKSESVAMWMLYTYTDNKGVLFKYKPKCIMDLLNSKNKQTIHIMNNDEFVCEIQPEDYEIELIDVAYLNEEDDNYVFKRSDNRKKIKKELFDNSYNLLQGKLDYFIKLYGWAYENECRLIVKVKKEFIKEYDENIDYHIILKPNCVKDNLSIISSPNYEGEPREKNNIQFKESFYKGKIHWIFEENKDHEEVKL